MQKNLNEFEKQEKKTDKNTQRHVIQKPYQIDTEQKVSSLFTQQIRDSH